MAKKEGKKVGVKRKDICSAFVDDTVLQDELRGYELARGAIDACKPIYEVIK